MTDVPKQAQGNCAKCWPRFFAVGIAAVAACASVVIFMCAIGPENLNAVRLPILAMMLAIMIVALARAMEESPESDSRNRRGAAMAASAAGLVRLWMMSFFALAVTFIAADLSSKIKHQPRADMSKLKITGKPVLKASAGRCEVQLNGFEEVGRPADTAAEKPAAAGSTSETKP
jgi:hypothetical protein